MGEATGSPKLGALGRSRSSPQYRLPKYCERRVLAPWDNTQGGITVSRYTYIDGISHSRKILESAFICYSGSICIQPGDEELDLSVNNLVGFDCLKNRRLRPYLTELQHLLLPCLLEIVMRISSPLYEGQQGKFHNEFVRNLRFHRHKKIFSPDHYPNPYPKAILPVPLSPEACSTYLTYLGLRASMRTPITGTSLPTHIA